MIGRLPDGKRLSKEDLIKSYDNHFGSGQGWNNEKAHHILDAAVHFYIKDYENIWEIGKM